MRKAIWSDLIIGLCLTSDQSLMQLECWTIFSHSCRETSTASTNTLSFMSLLSVICCSVGLTPLRQMMIVFWTEHLIYKNIKFQTTQQKNIILSQRKVHKCATAPLCIISMQIRANKERERRIESLEMIWSGVLCCSSCIHFLQDWVACLFVWRRSHKFFDLSVFLFMFLWLHAFECFAKIFCPPPWLTSNWVQCSCTVTSNK